MMEDQSEEFVYQFQRNQLDYFAQNPFLLEAQQIAFQEDFFPSKIQKEYKIPVSLSPLPNQNIEQIPYASKLQWLMKKKVRAGIQIMFGLSKESNESGFLQDIDAKIFQDSSQLVDLNKLFQQQCSSYSHHNSSFEELTSKMAEIQKKAFHGVCMNKTIGKAFYDHFQNFVYLQNESDFLKKFNVSFSKLLSDNYKLKNPGMNLILSIYEFWMRMFRDFIRQIWKHSEKFSMDLARQRHEAEKVYSSKSSTSESQLGERFQKDKRKPWKKDEIESLEKIIESNAIFNQARLNKLSQELGRTPSSISSKIQKMTKHKKHYKEEEIEQECISLDKKIEFILKKYPNGLSKEEVVLKLSEYYDMGEQENWKKSVSQLLSSKKQIEKLKGTYNLVSPNLVKLNLPANTMKDKLISCFLQIQNCDADLRTLTEVYLRVFGQQQDINPEDKQKIKALQMSISKTLCRYDIFNKDKCKTIYKLCQTKIVENMEIQDFLL